MHPHCLNATTRSIHNMFAHCSLCLNGAGKTTLMKILATLIPPSAGKAIVLGHDVCTSPEAVRRTIGYLPQEFGVCGRLSGWEFLDYVACLKGLEPGGGGRFTWRRRSPGWALPAGQAAGLEPTPGA